MKLAEKKENIDVFGWDKVRTEYAIAFNAAYHLGVKYGRRVGADAAATDNQRLLDEAENKLAQAYQVIGNLLHQTDKLQSDEGLRALDYFSDDSGFQEDFLPWPRALPLTTTEQANETG